MTRQAISPRLAIRIFCEHAGRAYQSGMLPCLRHGFSSFLSRSMRERGRCAARLVRHDHVVDEAAAAGDERVGELCAILRLARGDLGRIAFSSRKMISTAPFGPMTAISATATRS
jgi:hypothetical protein